MNHDRPLEAFEVLETPLAEGITLLEASAGTGKTWSLTTVAVRLLMEGDVESLDRVLMVTFTEAATAELKDRLRRRAVEALAVCRGETTDDSKLAALCRSAPEGAVDRLADALLRFDEVRVQTIHGFCAQLLRESAFELGQSFDVEAQDAGWPLAQQALRDAWRDAVHRAPAWFGEAVADLDLFPETLEPGLKACLLHPHAQLRPEAPDLESFLRAAEGQRAALAELWDVDRVVALVEASGWIGGGRKLGYPDTLVERLCRESGLPGPGLLAELSRRRLEKTAGKRNMKRAGSWEEFFVTDPLGQALAEPSLGVQEITSVFRNEILASTLRRYEEIKARAGVLDFDDLIERVHRQLQDRVANAALRRRVRSRLDVALIDEFQDTDQRQWEIFHALFADARLILVGDPKQAIYGFRGADVFAYLRASRSAGLRTTLDHNWRSHPQLVEGIHHLFGRHPDPFVFRAIAFPEVHGAVVAEHASLRGDSRPPLLVEVLSPEQFSRAPEARQESIRRTVEEIEGLLAARLRLTAREPADERPLDAGDIAVLVRRRREGRDVVDALRAAGIPSVLSALGDIYETTEMEELAVVLSAALRARHRGRRQRAVATLLWGAGLAETRAQLLDEEAETATVETLEILRAIWRESGLVGMATELFRRRRLRERMLALDDGERRYTNYQHAVEILDRHAAERDLEGEALVRWIRRARGQARVSEERELRLEQDAQAVQVVTMHGCKGLQYDIVFCPFLWDSTDRLQRNRPQLVHEEDGGTRWEIIDFEGTDSPLADRARAETLAENMRLTYVALTRARRRCVMTLARAGQSPWQSPTAFLLQRPPREEEESDAAWVHRARAEAQSQAASLEDIVDQLCHEAPGRIARVESGTLESQPPELTPTPPELRARQFPTGRALRSWTRTSFTNMTRSMTRSLTRGAPGVDLPDHFDPADVEPVAASADDGIGAFARGARAGICLHEILEEIDFAGDLQGISARVDRILSRHGLDAPGAHSAEIDPAAVVGDLLATVQGEPFADTGFRLGDIDLATRVHEWAFEARLGVEGAVSAGDLAAAFERHATGAWKNELVARLGRLPDERWRGLLRGFVDLVFERDGRWWVVDWKSNYLGPRPEDYGEAPLRNSMLTHHYLLQYHLYLVALHRHLRVRLSQYDPARQLGGAAYVFLRGLRGDGRSGWFVDRPPVALIEALDHVLDGKEAQ